VFQQIEVNLTWKKAKAVSKLSAKGCNHWVDPYLITLGNGDKISLGWLGLGSHVSITATSAFLM
jgi:hypothetical protein